jgi:hypothetical protein
VRKRDSLDSLAWLGQAAPLDRRHERRGRFGNWSVFASGSPQQNAQARRMRPRHLLPQDVRGRSCALAARHWDTQKHSAAKRAYIGLAALRAFCDLKLLRSEITVSEIPRR